MPVRIEDACFSRNHLNLVLRDVRKHIPGIKTSNARIQVTGSTNVHGQRWMTFEYKGTRVDGYYYNAWEVRIEGWNAYLRENGFED